MTQPTDSGSPRYGRYAAAALMCLVLAVVQCGRSEPSAPVVQKPLAFPPGALAPHISEATMDLHYGKHHAGYVAAVNRLAAGTPYARMTLAEIVDASAREPDGAKMFNNAAQAWNHAFFWKCLTPRGGAPAGPLADAIVSTFGSFNAFTEKFVGAAADRFGSGWVWLVREGDQLKIVTTANADTPRVHGMKPLFTVDLWEHAYYLDYHNRRGEYVKTVLEKLADWEFAAARWAESGKEK